MEKLSLEAMQNASEEAFRYAVVNAINQLYRDMNVGKVWDNTVGVERTNEKVASIDETQKISFETLANGGQIDEQVVLAHKESISEWVVGTFYKLGQYVRYNDLLYKVIQEHTAQADWTPDIAPSLYEVIDLEHAGTLEDPIPFATGMEVFNGKYYTYNDVLYLCTRDSGQALYNTPEELVGHYFEKVEV